MRQTFHQIDLYIDSTMEAYQTGVNNVALFDEIMKMEHPKQFLLSKLIPSTIESTSLWVSLKPRVRALNKIQDEIISRFGRKPRQQNRTILSFVPYRDSF